jgi:putative peptidoglycan lipid II flippase
MALIVALLLFGPVIEVIVPAFVQEREAAGEHRAWALYSTASAVLASIVTLIGGAVLANPDRSVRLFAPGFTDDQVRLTATLLVFTLWASVTTQLGYLAIRVLNVFGHFGLPEALTVLQPLAVIACTVALADEVGIVAIGVAQAISATVVAAVLFLLLYRVGYRGQFVASRAWPSLRWLLGLGASLYLVYAAGQLVTFVNGILGSLLPTGSLAALNYGQRLFEVPQIAILSVFALAVMPSVATHFAAGDQAALRTTVTQAIRGTVILALLVAAVGVGLSTPAVRVLLQWGAFTDSDTRLTSAVLAAFLVGSPGIGLWSMLSRILVATNRARLVTAIGVGVQILSVAMSISLVGSFGAVGLALAGGVGHIAGVAVMLVALSGILSLEAERWLLSFILRVGAAATAAYLIAAGAHAALEQLPGPPFVLGLVALFVGGSGALLMFVAVAYLLGISEVHSLVQRGITALQRRTLASQEQQ